MGDPARAPGADGLTADDLRRGRAEWWDGAFTALLREALPAGPGWLLDLGCGPGRAAETVLPGRPGLRYLGLDIEVERLRSCAEVLAARPGRDAVLAGSAFALPLGDDALDAVLCVSTLMHLATPEEALAEVRRVLRPGGRLVAVEPDNRVQLLRFDGPLPELEEAVGALFARAAARGQPAHPGLGPRLPALLRRTGFQRPSVRVHLPQSLHEERAEDFLDRIAWVVGVVAGAAGREAAAGEVARCEEVLAGLRQRLAGRRGFSLHAVPTWRCVALA